MEKYTIFIITGYKGVTPQMTLTEPCQIEVIADDVKTAMKKAKKLIKKENYRVKQVVEQYRK